MGCELSREFSNFGTGLTRECALSNILSGLIYNGYEIKQVRFADDDKSKMLYEDRDIFIKGYGLYRIVYKDRMHANGKKGIYEATIKFIGPELSFPGHNITLVDI